jgi:hypothetical protein
MGFDEPLEFGNGVRLYPKDIMGHLLLVWAVEYIPHSPSQFTQPGKPSDVVVVDAVDLDQLDPETQQQGLLARSTWWRQAQLIKALKTKVGGLSPLLVEMTKGTAAMGRTAPFVLVSRTQDPYAVQRANLWLKANPDYVPSKPMPPMPVAQDDGVDPWAGQTDPSMPDWAKPLPSQNLPPQRPPATVAPTPTQETMLEKMARLAASQQESVDRLSKLDYRGPATREEAGF